MTWFAFQGLNGGKAIDIAGAQEKDAVINGFHGYATQAQAEANPNSVNLITRVEADLLIADYKAAVAGGAQPGGPNASNPLAATGAAASTGAQDAAGVNFSSVQNALTGFYDVVTNGKMWRSLGWLLLGLVLMLLGLLLWIGPSAARQSPLGVAAKALG